MPRKPFELDPTNADLYGQLGDIYKRGRNFETSIIALRCAVEGCDALASCQAVLAGSSCVGVEVKPLVLNPNSATYYLDLGSVLSAFAPNKPEYCPEVVSLLTQLKVTYPDNTIITRNADVGLQICAEVTAGLTQTPVTTTPGALPRDHSHAHLRTYHSHALRYSRKIRRAHVGDAVSELC